MRQYAIQYNHLGQLTQVTDAAGVRTIGYNQYGEQETDSLLAGGKTHLITETRDALGRSAGYVYSKNGTAQQTVTTGYGSDGRISAAAFLHGGVERQFTYAYLPGTNLLHTLTKPNNMTLTQSYEPHRDLLTGMAYHRGSTLVAQRTYTYDSLGRPLTRTTSRNGQTVNDSFGYNSRSELTTATVNNGSYAYDYDNIGNRKTAQEKAEEITGYQANALNQYTMLSVDDIADFIPSYDAAGNQTRVKTSTGIWAISYDAENRPTDFTKVDSSGSTSIHCEYDHMGRRATKQVTTNGSITLHQRYIYRGYLQIACIDLTRSHHPALWYITWDPTQPVATRPLAIQKDGSWFTYGWDLTKNICELYGPSGYIRTAYTYSPYGQVTFTGDVEQTIQWSSEYNDTELGLVYYNYRHYNPVDGRWTGRDRKPTHNCYSFSGRCISTIDILGNEEVQVEIIGNDKHEVIRIKHGNIPETLNVDALVPLLKGPNESAATTQVLIKKKHISVKCKCENKLFISSSIKFRARILVLVNESEKTNVYYNPVFDRYETYNSYIEYIPTNDRSAKARVKDVMNAEMDHVKDFQAWLSSDYLKQRLRVRSRKYKYLNKKRCENEVKNLLLPLISDDYLYEIRMTRMKYDDGDNPKHKILNFIPTIADL